MFRGSSLAIGGAAVAALALALSPSLTSARSLPQQVSSIAASTPLGTFTPAGVDRRLAGMFDSRPMSEAGEFQFTPARIDRGSSRGMTIVVRSRKPATAGAVSVRAALESAGNGGNVQLKPTSYSLGAAKGLQSFALPTRKTAQTPMIDSMGDARGFSLDSGNKRSSRFSAKISSDQDRSEVPGTRALDRERGDSFDLGGSYSVTRAVDVTAGVRYKDGDERAPILTDSRQDSQAVYVGTLIRF